MRMEKTYDIIEDLLDRSIESLQKNQEWIPLFWDLTQEKNEAQINNMGRIYNEDHKSRCNGS